MPDFESKLQEAKCIASGYLDLTRSNADFRYTDVNHLWKESGQKVSRIIAEWIYNNEISLTKENKGSKMGTVHSNFSDSPTTGVCLEMVTGSSNVKR